MIAVVDYGMGNLRSVEKALARVGYAPRITRDVEVIRAASGVVLPGVGAFGACMANLRRFDLVPVLQEVVDRGTPFLGICLGMQVLFEESDEFGPVAGLGVLRGRVRRFEGADVADLRVPHMGWNALDRRLPVPQLEGVGVRFASSVCSRNVFGCQWHPEKSQEVGLRVLANFGALATAG